MTTRSDTDDASSSSTASNSGESTRRRVKLYALNDQRQWDDRGTGHITSGGGGGGSDILLVHAETDGSLLLKSRIDPQVAYQKQQETLIVWSEGENLDLALSFQERVGCDEIWAKICAVQGKDPSVEITQDIVEEEEDRFDDATDSMALNIELPPCEVEKLPELNDLIASCLPFPIKREKLAIALETENFIKKLILLFRTCEETRNMKALHKLYEIFKNIFLLNKNPLFEVMLAEENLWDVIGIFEYDPSSPEPKRHREYLQSVSRFKEVIRFGNQELINKIHQTYRVQYIQDVVLPTPSVFEENMLSTLSSFIFFNKVEIVTLIQEDEPFLRQLFAQLCDPETEQARRRDLILFLKEFCSFSQTLQPQNRENFYKTLSSLGILSTIQQTLAMDDQVIKTASVDILTYLVEFSPSMIREFALNQQQQQQATTSLTTPTITTIATTTTSSPSPSSSSPISASPSSCSSSSSSISSSSSNSASATTTATTASSTTTTTTTTSTSSPQPQQPNDQPQQSNSHDPHSPHQAHNHNHQPHPQPAHRDQFIVNVIIEQMINDTDAELGMANQLSGILRILVDPENMLASSVVNKSEKTDFLTFFYKHCMHVLVGPIMENTAEEAQGHGAPDQPSGQENENRPSIPLRSDNRTAQLLSIILELLSFFVEHHAYHIRNYILHKDLLRRILMLMKSRHTFLKLSALRFLRKIIGLKDEFYNRHIVNGNLFTYVIEAFKANNGRYNLLDSAIIELFEFIRTEEIKTLSTHIIEEHGRYLDRIDYVRTFKQLRQQYEQHQDRLSKGPVEPKVVLHGANRFRRDNRQLDEDEEIWFGADDDDVDDMDPSLSDTINYRLDNEFDQHPLNRRLGDRQKVADKRYDMEPVKTLPTPNRASPKRPNNLNSSSSPQSNNSTPSANLPTTRKGLVDYDEDSDEEEEEEDDELESECHSPKRARI